MKTLKKIYVLMAVVFFATACQDEELIPTEQPAAVGDEVIFGVRAGFENGNPDSRTVYTDETYTFEGKTYERIDWVGGEDMIEIYSPEASAPGTDDNKNSHYIVNSEVKDNGERNDFGSLERLEEAGSSLQWQGSGEHTFYAMYPSERMFDTENSEGHLITTEMGIELDGDTLKGVVPSSQNYKEIVKTSTGYEVKPDMRYAYMAAKTVTTPANPVELTFVPFVTAVEIELKNPEEGESISITDIQVTTSSGDVPIAGEFRAGLKGWDGVSYPTCVVGDKTETLIHLSVRSVAGDPLTLASGQTLKFTVFMLPTQDLGNLVVKYTEGSGGFAAKTLDFNAILEKPLPAHLKTLIKDLNLPKNEFEIDASNWMSQLPQTVSMRKLSIPGTGGTFSYNYNGSDPNYYKQQTLNLEEQWRMGARAFEVVVDRSSDTRASLGDELVKCNKTSVGVTFNSVMEKLTNWVSKTYPNECAVVILTYQPEDNNPKRNVEGFASNLKVWYDKFANKEVLKKYSPDITLGDAKGKVLMLVRMNQKDEKDNGDYATAVNTLSETPFVLIDGCGTAKDRWGARGYKLGDVNFPHISNGHDDNKIIETFMENGYLFTTTSGKYTTSYTSGDHVIKRAKPNTPDDLNFGFSTNDSTVVCWYQEWARVVDGPFFKQGSWFSNDFYWFESYYEKLNNAITTFTMAVSNSYSNYIFINSLCGYLVTSSFSDSSVPSTGYTYGGSGGDIKGLADKITPAFYEYVNERGFENTTGPTGVVLMDYLSNDIEGKQPAALLPGKIIVNNFMHNK